MIRRAVPADREAVRALHLLSWQDAYAGVLPPDYLRDGLPAAMRAKWAARTFEAPELTLVALADTELTGFACALRDRDPPLIDNLHVRPDLRGGGTGGKLLAAILLALGEAGHARAFLTVLGENQAAHRFYMAHGGEDEGMVDDMLVGHPVRARRVGFALR